MPNIDTLLYELAQLGDPVPQSRLMAKIRSFKGERFYFAKSSLVPPEQDWLAVALLRSGMSRAEVSHALAERLQVSVSTANRIIKRVTKQQQPTQLDLLP